MCLAMLDRTHWPREYLKSGVVIHIWKLLKWEDFQKIRLVTPVLEYPVEGSTLEAVPRNVLELEVYIRVVFPNATKIPEGLTMPVNRGPKDVGKDYIFFTGNLQHIPALTDWVKKEGGTWEVTRLTQHGGGIHCYRFWKDAMDDFFFTANPIIVNGIGFSDDIIGVGENGDIVFKKIQFTSIVTKDDMGYEEKRRAEKLLQI